MSSALPSLRNHQPNLGLVCITIGDHIRFRTITRKRLLQFTELEQPEILRNLYKANLARLQNARDFCLLHNIKLYRYPTGIFPFADTPVGASVLTEFSDDLKKAGQQATQSGIRLVVHPEQYVVLSLESPAIVANSIMILESQTWLMDLLDQPRTSWALIEVSLSPCQCTNACRARVRPRSVRSKCPLCRRTVPLRSA